MGYARSAETPTGARWLSASTVCSVRPSRGGNPTRRTGANRSMNDCSAIIKRLGATRGLSVIHLVEGALGVHCACREGGSCVIALPPALRLVG